MRPPSSNQSTNTVPVPITRLTMMCLCASITCSAELRSIRWKPMKRDAVSAPSRIWMSNQNEKVNSRLDAISTAQRRLRHLCTFCAFSCAIIAACSLSLLVARLSTWTS